METTIRVRKHGTVETVAGNADDRIKAIRLVVENKQYAKIDGCMVDLFSANVVCQVYNALSKGNQRKFANHNAAAMCKIAFKILRERI